MKTFENQQKPKEYDRFQGQDHGTRGTDERWDFSEQVDIDKAEAHQEFVAQQEITEGIEDYTNSEFFKLPTLRETSPVDDIEANLADSELVYTTDINRLPEDDSEVIDQDFEFDNSDSGLYEAQLFSQYTRKQKKARQAELDHESDQDDHGDDFPNGMHITNRP